VEGADRSPERYGLSWPGKCDAVRNIDEECTAALQPFPAESVAFSETANMLIEGDNLAVLRLLQQTHLGRVKLIYIDPPYNGGKDLVYRDDFREGLQGYLRATGQLDEQGMKLNTAAETDGRYHAKWLTMIYPRLALARRLLRDDGVIFISIDDREVHHLRLIMNELYGEENFVACIANVNNPKGRSDDKHIATAHEYLLVYQRGNLQLHGWAPEEKVTRRYRLTDPATGRQYRELDLRKTGSNDRRADRPKLFYYFLYSEPSGDFYPTREESVPPGYIQIRPLREDGTDGNWRWELSTAADRMTRLVPRLMPRRKVWSVFEKDFLEEDEIVRPTSAWLQTDINSERGSEQMVDLGFAKETFPYPKPLGLLRRILQLATRPRAGDIVLDFFAGSCTTAHAVLALNYEDGGDRRFICVQLPEPTPAGSAARTAGFSTIMEIGKARTERVIAKLASDSAHNPPGAAIDLGFQFFRLR